MSPGSYINLLLILPAGRMVLFYTSWENSVILINYFFCTYYSAVQNTVNSEVD